MSSFMTIPRRAVIRKFSGKSRTEQSHRKNVNINSIMRKYRATGLLPSSRHPGQYGDFTKAVDYQTSLNQVMDAQEEFNSLPSHIRKRFFNDPAELLRFMEDENNLEEAIKLGIIAEPEQEIPNVGDIVTPPTKEDSSESDITNAN